MHRFVHTTLAALAVTGGVALVAASPASADKPLLFEEGDFDDTFIVPGGVGVCEFDIQGRDVGTFTTTVFFDRDGATRLAKNHSNGMTYWSLPGGDVVAIEHWVGNSFFELAPGSTPETPPLNRTTVGNPWNVHGGAGGVLVNDSGRVVFDGEGNVVTVNGPHQALFGEFGGLCDALAASAG